MGDLAQHTRERWNGLAAAGVQYSRPWLDLDQATARARVDPLGLLGDLAGKRVLCLAAGGGQQSAAFGMLGADVTVFDLSDEMLARDREAAEHYGLKPRLIQGDAQDLSALADQAFDFVGFVFLDVHEEPHGNGGPKPGSWDPFCSVVPPWLCIWARLAPLPRG